MRRVAWLLGLALASACGAGGGDDGDDGSDAPITLAFTAPAPHASFTRDHVATSGFLVADAAAQVAITGAPARVVLSVAGHIVGELDGSGAGTAELPAAGDVALVAVAYDGAGHPVASAEVPVTVAEPDVASCHDWLDLYGITYDVGPDAMGVDDPVTATPPFLGVAYRYIENAAPRTEMFADCNLILSLAKAAPIFRSFGITEVADIGVYNFRCIGGGEPPCENGISQHASATAIDIGGVTDGDGTFYSVETDWVIDPAEQATCSADTEPGKDAFLHELICALKAAGTWNIVLTPNYNADHRNHFHVDLTPGSDFLRERRGVDDAPADGDPRD